jgi:hypothetical protein
MIIALELEQLETIISKLDDKQLNEAKFWLRCVDRFGPKATESLTAHDEMKKTREVLAALKHQVGQLRKPPRKRYSGKKLLNGASMTRPVGRCIGCMHDFRYGFCDGCGATPNPQYESQCDEECHESGLDDCALCGSGDSRLMCNSCRAYAAEDMRGRS